MGLFNCFGRRKQRSTPEASFLPQHNISKLSEGQHQSSNIGATSVTPPPKSSTIDSYAVADHAVLGSPSDIHRGHAPPRVIVSDTTVAEPTNTQSQESVSIANSARRNASTTGHSTVHPDTSAVSTSQYVTPAYVRNELSTTQSSNPQLQIGQTSVVVPATLAPRYGQFTFSSPARGATAPNNLSIGQHLSNETNFRFVYPTPVTSHSPPRGDFTFTSSGPSRNINNEGAGNELDSDRRSRAGTGSGNLFAPNPPFIPSQSTATQSSQPQSSQFSSVVPPSSQTSVYSSAPGQIPINGTLSPISRLSQPTSTAPSDAGAFSPVPPPQSSRSFSTYVAAQSYYPQHTYTPAPTQPPATRVSSSTLLPGPSSPPRCLDCGLTTDWHVVRPDNRYGNAGRPYYKCRCGWWASFADDIGNHPWNPPCSCGIASRRQRMNGKPVYFYRCRMGTCRRTFTESPEQAREQRWRLDRGIVEGMAGLSL